VTASDIALRPATDRDAVAIADLYSAARVAAVPAMPPAMHTNVEDREWFAARLSDDEHTVWLAEADGDVLGYAMFTNTWLDQLFIRADRTGRGIGTMLLDAVKSFRPDGFCLWVFEQNERARAFYRERGLVELERTDGSGNEEHSPDVRMAWPGADPLRFFRRLIDDVDRDLGDLLSRRAALTAAVQPLKPVGERDPEREREIVARLAARVPELGEERLTRIVHAIITESLDAAGH
jgi:chorismate mutase/GNAT superfamily N-acetyltransferase